MDRDWRCQKYGPLGWMELFIKAIAVCVGIVSLSAFNNENRKYSPTRITEGALLCVAGAGIIAYFLQRIFDKEIIILVFTGANIVGHWILVIVTFLSRDPGAWIFTYVFLMALGEKVRLCFLCLSENPDVKFLTKPMLLVITVLFLVIWYIIIILQIVIWLIEYD